MALVVVVLAMVIGWGRVVEAQTSKGILQGEVRDTTGAMIPGATVTVTAENGGDRRATSTNGEGAYRVEAINPGPYTVRVEAKGFAVMEVQHVPVAPSLESSYNAVLKAGTEQRVEVSAYDTGIQTSDGTLAGTIGQQELQTLPIFSLNPIELVTTLPGVQVIDQNLGLGALGGDGVQIQSNGARGRANYFMMDGQDINDVTIMGQAFMPVIPDVFQSVVTMTNSASAEYGRASGAIVNLVTKSGTNTIHGSAWELYSGSGLDSQPGTVRGTAALKARYDEHQVGFTLGGPILRDKLFGFGGTQFSRFYGNTLATPVELPDAAGYAQLTAIGGAQVALLQSYLNNGTYLTSFTNTSAGVGLGYASRIKVSSRTGCSGGCTVETALFQRPPVPEQNPETQWMYRVDYLPRQRDIFSWRYLHDRLTLTPELILNTSGLPGFDGEVAGPSEVGQGTWTHLFTERLLNEFRASETRVSYLFQATPETQANPLVNNPTLVFSGQGFGGGGLGVSQNIPQGRQEDLYQFQDTVSWNHGRQTMRAGADIGRQIEKDLVPQNALGQLTFTSGGALSPLDNFLDNYLGVSGTATKTVGPTRIDPHAWKVGLFAQDDVRLRPSLVVNLGLRYDYVTDPENSLPYPGVDPNNPFVPISTVVKVADDKNNFAPHVGFAWNPAWGWFHDGKTVVRGGFAGFYDLVFSNIVVTAAQSSPNAISGTLTATNKVTNPRGLGNATTLIPTISPVLNNQSTVTGVASNLVNPVTWQWNLGVERQLPGAMLLNVNYIGNVGENLFANQQLNYTVNNARLNTSRGIINIRGNRAASEYNALQTELTRRFTHGLFFRATYTYGKNLDDNSEVFSTYAAPTAYSADLSANNLHSDWGPSVWDHRHYASFSYAWSPAGFGASNAAADAVLAAVTRHWTISGITQFQSGPYTTFNFNGLDSNGDGSAQNDRPILGNASKPLDTVAFDGALFGPPYTPGLYYDYVTGNQVTANDEHWLVPATNGYIPQEIGRNSFKNPGTQYWNLAVEKDVPAAWLKFDRGTFVFRAEAQNFTNHDNLGPLDLNLLDIGTPNYMSRHNAIEPMNRSLLLWAKLRFAAPVIDPLP